MLHHLKENPQAVFLTLTYSDDQVVRRGNGTAMLVKSDVQKFFKRLRINRFRSGRSSNISYYACGEYGERTQRPHYHAIVFGLDFNDVDRGDVADAWHHGHTDFGLVTPASIRYVAGYIDKKVLGYADAFQGREGEFQLVSNGIGLQWCKENMVQLLYDGGLSFEGNALPLSRYYREKLRELWPEAMEGVGMRIVEASAKAELDLYLEIVPEFGGRKYSELTMTERSLLAARIYARNQVYAHELEQGLRVRRMLKERI